MDGVLNNPKESKEAQLDLITHVENIWLGSEMRAMCLPGFEREQAIIDRSFGAFRVDVVEKKNYTNDEDGLNALKDDMCLVAHYMKWTWQRA